MKNINFMTNKNKSKSQVGKSKIKQSNVTVNFIRMCYLFYKMFSKMTHLIETQRIEILIFIGCVDKTR
jgi:hypothetical protein